MRAKFTTTILFMALVQLSFGQITDQEARLRGKNNDTIQGWKRGGLISINLAQTSLTNWAAGGQNSFAVNGLLSLFANYKNAKSAWDNSLDIGYGILNQGKNSDFIKTDDKFDFLSKYGREAFKNVYYAALLNFKTQMTIGRDYAKDTAKISNFFAPAYIVGALGLDYKPSSYFSAFVAPVTAKFTIVNDQDLANAGAFGVTPATYDGSGNLLKEGKKSKSELGGYIRVIYTKNDFKGEFLKNVSFTSKVDLFSNYSHNPQNIDVSWETLIVLKVNKFIGVNISTHLLYDDDIEIPIDKNGDGTIDESGPRVQFKEILGVGFSYKF
ncbi:MAG TPA: DUF3078 domain-containing protein [Bacteroidales bacterium]|nr:DUF3078 domain-containing protein [Bacteroidales bacterium]